MKTVISAIVTVSLLIPGMTAFSPEKDHHNSNAGTESRRPDVQYAWKVNWNKLDEGIKKSKKERKPMLVDFAVHEGCPRCDFLQKNVYSRDSIVAKINKDFIPIFIDLAYDLTPDEQALGEKHEFHDDCLLLFLNHQMEPVLDPDGNKMCFAEEIKPGTFKRYLDYVIGMYESKFNF
jgi:hypothetical protein